MTIAGITDLYVYAVGLLYPAYQTLLYRDDPDKMAFMQKYWTVFALYYVTCETTEMTMQMMIPLLRVFQMVGVTLMVIPTTNIANALYSNLVIPTFEQNREKIQDSFGTVRKSAWQLWDTVKLYLATEN